MNLSPRATRKLTPDAVRAFGYAFLLVVWCVLATWAYLSRQQVLDHAHRVMTQSVSVLKAQTQQTLSLLRMALFAADDWLLAHPVRHPESDPGFIRLIDGLRKNSEQRIDLRMVSADGRLLYVPPRPEATITHVYDREYFRVQQDPRTRGLHIAAPLVSRVTKKWGIPISVPASPNSGQISVLFGALELDRLIALQTPLINSPSERLTLIRQDGLVLSSVPFKEGFIGQRLMDLEGWQYLKDQQGIFTMQHAPSDGQERLIAYSRLDEYGVIAVRSVAIDEILADWRSLVGHVTLGLLLTSFILIFLIEKLARSLQRTDAAMRRIAEQAAALQAVNEHLAAAASAGIIGIWDWEIGTDKLHWDSVMHGLYGRSVQHFAGNLAAWTEHVHPEDRPRIEQDIAAAQRDAGLFAAEFRVIWPDGSIRYLKAVARTSFDNSGRALRMVGVSYDQTAEKNAAALLEEKITERTRELQEARLKAEAANITKSAFLANMSHEMRTPLHQIGSLGMLIRRDPLSPKQSDYLDKLDSASHHLASLIDTILKLTEIEAGQLIPAESPFNLPVLLQECLARGGEQAKAKDLRLRGQIEGLPDQLIGDRSLVQQALQHYLSNAIRFTEHGEIAIRIELLRELENKLLIRVAVRDSGVGIAPADLPRLFNIFEQVDMSSTRQYGGLGLGLAMTRKIAELLGGEAGCDSQPGQGSTFWFTCVLKKAA